MSNLVILHVALAVVAFLTVLNGYLRGAWKSLIDAALGLALIVLLVLGFIHFGFVTGLLAVGATIVYGVALNSLAKIIAYKMLGYRTTLPESNRSASRDFMEGRIGLDQFVERSEREIQETEERLRRLSEQESIQDVLVSHGKTKEDLEMYLDVLRSSGCKANVALNYLSDPHYLSRVIKNVDQETVGAELLANLRK